MTRLRKERGAWRHTFANVRRPTTGRVIARIGGRVEIDSRCRCLGTCRCRYPSWDVVTLPERAVRLEEVPGWETPDDRSTDLVIFHLVRSQRLAHDQRPIVALVLDERSEDPNDLVAVTRLELLRWRSDHARTVACYASGTGSREFIRTSLRPRMVAAPSLTPPRW